MQPSVPSDDASGLNRQVDAAAALADSAPTDRSIRGAVPGVAASAKEAVTRTSLTSVQALRGIAMTLVVVHHILYYMLNRLSAWTIDGSVLRRFPVLAEFAFGVDIFFTISGFLLVLIAKPYLDRRRTIINFVLHRLLRIWPLYILVTCFMLVREYVSLPDGAALPFDFGWRRLASFLFIPSWNERQQFSMIYQPGWTLAFEVWFYACFALALKFSRSRRELFSSVSAILLGGMVLGSCLPDGGIAQSFFSNLIAIEFLIGAGICVAIQAGYRIPFAPSWWLAAGLTWLFVAVSIDSSEGWRLGTRGIPAAMVLIAALKMEASAKFPVWLVAIGHASYSVFLTHDLILGRIANAVIGALDNVIPRSLLGETASILTLVPTVFIGWVVFQLIEKPINKFVKAWIGTS